MIDAVRQWFRSLNYDVHVRYYPVAQAIRSADPNRMWRVLDIGSGRAGVSPFLRGWSVVGLDRALDSSEAAEMPLVKGSVDALPFPDQSCDVVVCVDVIEHLAPDQRRKALDELLRVMRMRLIVAFPFGAQAREADRRMAEAYGAGGNEAPPWLSEHLRQAHPERELVIDAVEIARQADPSLKWSVSFNEDLRLQRVHRFLATRFVPGYRVFTVLCSLIAPLLERRLPERTSYRCIYSISRDESTRPS